VSEQYLWASPGPEGAPTKLRAYQTLAELSAATGQEAHGVELDYDIFENLRAPSITPKIWISACVPAARPWTPASGCPTSTTILPAKRRTWAPWRPASPRRYTGNPGQYPQSPISPTGK
jgi:hypothetical protein